MKNELNDIQKDLEAVIKLTELLKEWFTEEQLREMEEKYNRIKEELEKKK